jgi:PAS domain S-box-containing protein
MKVDILVADDRKEDLLAISAVLENPEMNVVTAQTGQEALRRVLERDFAVILLDVMMPDMQGFEVATIIKQRARSRHTPIIFLTAAANDVRYIYKAYQAGAVDYLGKPIDPDILRAKVGTFVELFKKDHRIAAQAEALRAAEIAELRSATERRYRNLAESIPAIVWTADADGTVGYFNQRWYELTGQTPPEAAGGGWTAALHPEDVARHVAAWEAARATGQVLELECRVRRHDGEYRWHLCRAVPDRDDGKVVGWLGTYTDCDDRRRALDAAHAAVRARDEFLSIASHELRTPLMTLILRLDSLSARFPQDQLRPAMRQAERLVSLVDSLLDVSRIATGRLVLQPEPLELTEVVRDVVDRFTEAAERAGCELVLHVDEPVPGVWDRLRIEQILQNLLANAIKYAPRKPVEIEVSSAGDVANLAVADHGIGIAAEDLERVFGQFERAVSAQHYGGLGMGLHIAREIATAHGGSIHVTSTPGAGSTFHVALPRHGSSVQAVGRATSVP